MGGLRGPWVCGVRFWSWTLGFTTDSESGDGDACFSQPVQRADVEICVPYCGLLRSSCVCRWRIRRVHIRTRILTWWQPWRERGFRFCSWTRRCLSIVPIEPPHGWFWQIACIYACSVHPVWYWRRSWFPGSFFLSSLFGLFCLNRFCAQGGSPSSSVGDCGVWYCCPAVVVDVFGWGAEGVWVFECGEGA